MTVHVFVLVCLAFPLFSWCPHSDYERLMYFYGVCVVRSLILFCCTHHSVGTNYEPYWSFCGLKMWCYFLLLLGWISMGSSHRGGYRLARLHHMRNLMNHVMKTSQLMSTPITQHLNLIGHVIKTSQSMYSVMLLCFVIRHRHLNYRYHWHSARSWHYCIHQSTHSVMLQCCVILLLHPSCRYHWHSARRLHYWIHQLTSSAMLLCSVIRLLHPSCRYHWHSARRLRYWIHQSTYSAMLLCSVIRLLHPSCRYHWHSARSLRYWIHQSTSSAMLLCSVFRHLHLSYRYHWHSAWDWHHWIHQVNQWARLAGFPVSYHMSHHMSQSFSTSTGNWITYSETLAVFVWLVFQKFFCRQG